MPPRSREPSKPLPKADVQPQNRTVVGASDSGAENTTGEPKPSDTLRAKTQEKAQATKGAEEPSSTESRKTWYGGTLPRTPKATPVTQVATESISSEAVSTARGHASPKSTTPLRAPSLYLSRSKGSSSRSLPLVATTTKVHITSNAADSRNRVNLTGEQLHAPAPGLDGAADKTVESKEAGNAPKKDTPPNSSADVLNAEDKQGVIDGVRGPSLGWMGWFVRPAEEQLQASQTLQHSLISNGESPPAAAQGPSPSGESVTSQKDSNERRKSDPNPISAIPKQDPPPRSSWLGLWGSAKQSSHDDQGTNTASAASTRESIPTLDHVHLEENVNEITGEAAASSPRIADQPAATGKPSGWAFWSRDHPAQGKHGEDGEDTRSGKSAAAGLPSQPKSESTAVSDAKTSSKPVKGIPSSESSNSTKQAPPSNTRDGTAIILPDTQIAGTLDNHPQGTKGKQSAVNLLLPSFESTYRPAVKPTLLQQVGRLLNYNKPTCHSKHVSLLHQPLQIKKALAIGVHGYFPAPLLRSVLGQPTGTSMRFANGAANAIQAWTVRQGYSCEIEKVALEGEGKIAERIDVLWKLILNWMDHIRKADFVMIACHSQGVPVAMMLVSKLIAFGCVNGARIGVCAMAGVNLGPFGDYRSRWISGSAGELFEFAEANSKVSKDYQAALSNVLRFGVRVLYAGSIDDQLVSLESATFGTIVHPYIFRAVFVDGRLHAPNFLSHLVGFALKLRNLGVSDHGLIRELSAPLAGSLYSGEGHSRIYDDDAVYYLAVQHALETTSIGDVPIQRLSDGPVASQNPYILPFAMRGLLEEDYVRTELYDERTELLKQFDEWKPSSKVLKDVRYRLLGLSHTRR